MTNLQKASDLISDILDLKLGVGDIVEYNCYRYIVINVLKNKIRLIGKYCRCSGDFTATVLELTTTKDFKLIRRNITLPMVLEAWYEKDGRPTGAGWNEFIYNYQDSIIPLIAKWIPKKDGKDLSLFDQKNEKLYKFLINTLGESK